MSNLASSLILSATLFLVWYGVATARILRKQGFDPSLITYVTPLRQADYNLSRFLNLAAILSAVLAGQFSLAAPLALVIFGLFQLLLLIIFSRTGTQPFLYYSLVAVEGSWLCLNVSTNISLPIAIAIFLVQELSLRRWLAKRQTHYNRWVAKKAVNIHNAYKEISAELTAYEWFFVLHFAVTESIARPRVVRHLERVYFKVKSPETISSGIMQVKDNKLLSDKESMSKGSRIVCEALRQMPSHLKEPVAQLKWLARSYNGSINEKANDDYTGYLLATYPGLLIAWERLGY